MPPHPHPQPTQTLTSQSERFKEGQPASGATRERPGQIAEINKARANNKATCLLSATFQGNSTPDLELKTATSGKTLTQIMGNGKSLEGDKFSQCLVCPFSATVHGGATWWIPWTKPKRINERLNL